MLDEIERNGGERIIKFDSHEFRISHLMQLYTPRAGLITANLLVGVARNDVKVNIRGGVHATTTNNHSTCVHLAESRLKFCANIPPKGLDPVLNGPEQHLGLCTGV